MTRLSERRVGITHVSRDFLPDDIPEVIPGCCIGSAVYGPGRCTCWDPVYDREQQPIIEAALVWAVCEGIAAMFGTWAPDQERQMCDSCAFRPGSPERCGDERYDNSAEGDIDWLVAHDSPFWCHEGMVTRVALEHPCGERWDDPLASTFGPPIRDGVPFQADGTPAHVCAGWLARHRVFVRDADAIPEPDPELDALLRPAARPTIPFEMRPVLSLDDEVA